MSNPDKPRNAIAPALGFALIGIAFFILAILDRAGTITLNPGFWIVMIIGGVINIGGAAILMTKKKK
jgi:hypothetical protein